jgi:hypothetical protein
MAQFETDLTCTCSTAPSNLTDHTQHQPTCAVFIHGPLATDETIVVVRPGTS